MRSIFFNDTATAEIYTLSLHGALPIFAVAVLPHAEVRERLHRAERAEAAARAGEVGVDARARGRRARAVLRGLQRSEEHTSELQSRQYLVCRLLLEKKPPRPIIHVLAA